MSQLTKALERISNWYKVNKPDEYPIFQPGLSREYIEEQWQKLDSDFPIPDEIYELYKYCEKLVVLFIKYHL